MAKLTIGQLAKRVGLRPSALRYYEEQGLLQPEARTEAGYRLYGETAVTTLAFIQRAQRLGLSLADIGRLLHGYQSGDLSDETIIRIVEARALSLERQLTELLVLQHELDLFLQDIRHEHEEQVPQDHAGSDHFDKLLQQICLNPHQQSPRNWLDWLIEVAGCELQSQAGQAILKQLEGLHTHVWQEDEGYHILLVSQDTAVAGALADLARLEDNCQAPSHHNLTAVSFHDQQGHHLIVRGDNAFLYARLFLALEQSTTA